MAKRSAKFQKSVDKINSILALDKIYLTDGENCRYAGSEEPIAKAFKEGMASALEIMLHGHNSYNGFMFLDLNDADHHIRSFNRKYF